MGFFDIGLLEILVILAVILLVAGPDRIPEYARKAGRLVRNIRKMTSEFSGEMTKALDLDGEVEDMKSTAADIRATLKGEAAELQETLAAEAREVKKTLDAETADLAETIDASSKEVKEMLEKEAKDLAETIDAEAKGVKKTLSEGAEEFKEALDKGAKDLAKASEAVNGEAGKTKKTPKKKAAKKEPVKAVGSGDVAPPGEDEMGDETG